MTGKCGKTDYPVNVVSIAVLVRRNMCAHMFSKAGSKRNPSRKASYVERSSKVERVSSRSSERKKGDLIPAMRTTSALNIAASRSLSPFVAVIEGRSQGGRRAQHQSGRAFTYCQSATDSYILVSALSWLITNVANLLCW